MKKLILILIILSLCSCSSYSVIGKYVRYLNMEGTAGNTMIVFKNDSFGFMTDTVKIYPHYNAILLDNWIYLRKVQ